MDNNLTPMNLLTKVRVLRGVPFDSNYRNVCDGYSSADDQYTKITTGRVKYTYENISPIRHQNVLRLPVCADFLYDCNYLVWQNANFTNKWFYAFITKVDWININCCHVHYQIDVWNTWYYDGMTSDRTARGWQFERSFVEREHTNNDTVGANLVPENLDIGEKVWASETMHSFSINNCDIGLLCNFEWNDAPAPPTSRLEDFKGEKYGFIYSGLNIIMCPNVESLNALIGTVIDVFETTDGIVGAYMIPQQFRGNAIHVGALTYYKFNSTTFNDISVLRPSAYDGYHPRNNKLLTYPYISVKVANNQSTIAEYGYEYFADPSTAKFKVIGDAVGGNVAFAFVPYQYKGSNGTNFDQSVDITTLPQCAFNSDTFKQWMALNKFNVATSLMSSGVSMMGHLSGGASQSSNAMGIMANHYGAMNGLGETFLDGSELVTQNSISSQGQLGAVQDALQITNILGNVAIQSRLPNTIHGMQSSSLLMQNQDLKFLYGLYHIRSEFARIIDDYFDRFGYATHRLKIPNQRGRAQWNYIKTVGCSVEPLKMSLEVAPVIEDMFDNGVTIWHNINNIGNYSLSNPIVNN